MGSLHKNIQLMLEFLKAPYLVLRFSYISIGITSNSLYNLHLFWPDILGINMDRPFCIDIDSQAWTDSCS